uniref:BTB domain-containing protein n=1 Tax=Anopheles maculatus TaxID=74869 RepID=A0A182SWC3_9DIPT
MLQSHQYTDCRLIVPDGELLANRTMLCMASRFFDTIFARTESTPVLAADFYTVLIPDVKLSEISTVNDNSSSLEYAIENDDGSEQELAHHEPPDGLYSADNSTDCNSKPDEQPNTSSYETRLSAAIDAVLNQGTSYRLASKRYNIAKTVLWRRTMKMPRPIRSSSPKLGNQRRKAIDALKTGEKLIYVSQRFEIPLSTLHRDKIRLYNKGILPGQVTLAQRDKGDSFRQRLTESVGECIAGRMSLSEAARVYKLPKTTIWRRVRMSQANNSCLEANEVEANQSTERYVANYTAQNADHTLEGLQSEPLHDGEEFMSDTNVNISCTTLTGDSIIL